ncbi:hypothetical protein SAMN04488112_10665 [Melghirimyces thermohalophilus]|uniref:Uncharacterized protein n=1 Tax=Melghirimyces thermohalophilus TaxID=1236220 RepID=A0A1G6KMT3_9BACL|nr:hypothetical protein SAMN04488112_10665 [Melghirimyces thermohalophilus]
MRSVALKLPLLIFQRPKRCRIWHRAWIILRRVAGLHRASPSTSLDNEQINLFDCN